MKAYSIIALMLLLVLGLAGASAFAGEERFDKENFRVFGGFDRDDFRGFDNRRFRDFDEEDFRRFNFNRNDFRDFDEEDFRKFNFDRDKKFNRGFDARVVPGDNFRDFDFD